MNSEMSTDDEELNAFWQHMNRTVPYCIKRRCARCGNVYRLEDMRIKRVYEYNKRIVLYPRCPKCNIPMKMISYKKGKDRRSLHNYLWNCEYRYWNGLEFV